MVVCGRPPDARERQQHWNGYGDHNIQGIGDKHVPLIHNVMNTDDVVAVSDRSTDALDALFNTDAGKALFFSVNRNVVADEKALKMTFSFQMQTQKKRPNSTSSILSGQA